MTRIRAVVMCTTVFSLLLIGGPVSGGPAEGDADVTTQEHGRPGISADAHYESATIGSPPAAAQSSTRAAASAATNSAATGAGGDDFAAASGEVSSVLPGLPAYTGSSADPATSWLDGPHPCFQVKVGPLDNAWCTDSTPGSGGGRPGPGPGGNGPPPPSPKELAVVAADRATAAAPRPRLRLAPTSIGLTGLESYFWLADRLRPITAVARVPGLTVVAEARPVQYVWHFGDGLEAVTTDSGTPWRPGRSGSVSHLYEVRGRYRLVVEAIWEARWRSGNGPWRSLGFFTTTGNRNYPVRQVVTRLVPGS